MRQGTTVSILTLSILAIVSTVSALAQTVTAEQPAVTPSVATGKVVRSWQAAQSAASPKIRLDVVTVDQPQRRHSCRVQSFTLDKLVCSGAVSVHTYSRQQILALIRPGGDQLRIRLFIGFNAGLGAAIWGTVVLAATCPVCAAATSLAALFFFSAAGVTSFADGQEDTLVYLAPGQHLTGRLRSLQP